MNDPQTTRSCVRWYDDEPQSGATSVQILGAVIFKTCPEDLSVHARDQDVAIPLFTHNNNTIFVLVIDIFDYPQPASKRGHLNGETLKP